MRALIPGLLLLVSTAAFGLGCTGTGSCYWVGGDGNGDDVLHWATTDGGVVVGGLPSSADNCIFTNQSSTLNAAYQLTLNTSLTLTCKNFSMSGPGSSNKVTVSSGFTYNNTIAVYGSLNLIGGAAEIDWQLLGALAFVATNSQTITTNGTDFTPTTLYFNGVGGTWALQDDITLLDPTYGSYMEVNNGTLNLNGKVLPVGYVYFLGASARTIKDGVGGGKLSVAYELYAETTNLTIDRTNPWTLEMSGVWLSPAITLGPTNGSGPAWPAVVLANTVPSNFIFGGGGTMKSLSVLHPPQQISFGSATVHKIEDANGFPSGTAGNLVTVTKASGSSYTLNSVNSELQISDCLSISDSTATPAATWSATHYVDGGGNTDWTFTAPSGCAAAPSTTNSGFLGFF